MIPMKILLEKEKAVDPLPRLRGYDQQGFAPCGMRAHLVYHTVSNAHNAHVAHTPHIVFAAASLLSSCLFFPRTAVFWTCCASSKLTIYGLRKRHRLHVEVIIVFTELLETC